MIKAALLDFDGTLVYRDILDVVCSIVDKESESEQINREFHEGHRVGLSALVKRINLLRGVSQKQIDDKLREEAYLMPGARELLRYFQSHDIVTILCSGNIRPVLLAYQKILGLDYIVGSEPKMNGDVIEGISEAQFSGPNFKIDGIKEILTKLDIAAIDTVAIGDSPADRQMFEFVGTSIAINPKGRVEDVADYVIKDDLRNAVEIIEQRLKK